MHAFNNTFIIQRIYIAIIINISIIVGVHNDKLNYQWPLMCIIPGKLDYRQRLLASAIPGKFNYHISIRCGLRGIESFRFIQTCNFANVVSFNQVSFHVPYISLSFSRLSKEQSIFRGIYSVNPHIHRMSTYDEMRRSRRRRRRRHSREKDGRDTSCRLHAPTYVCQRCDLRDNVNSLVKGPAERNCRNEEKREGEKREREREHKGETREKGGRGERNTSVYDRYICKRDACNSIYVYRSSYTYT